MSLIDVLKISWFQVYISSVPVMFNLLLRFCLSVLLLEEDSTQQAWLTAFFVNILHPFSATILNP